MQEKSGSTFWRWLTVCGLTLAALPLFLAWRASGGKILDANRARSWDAQAGRVWVRPNEIAVQFRPGADAALLSNLGAQYNGTLAWNSDLGPRTGIARMTLSPGLNLESTLAALRRDPRVEAVDVVHMYYAPVEMNETPLPPTDSEEPQRGRWKPNDPRYNEQWNFQMIKAEEAWPVTKGKNVIVAVIDTGVAYKDTKKGKLARDFKNTKFVEGYDFVKRDRFPNDDHGHGTHVAGTIAESTNNNEGVAGLAFEAAIMPIKVLSASGGGSSADIAEAIRWAADNGANVINMSLGGPFPDKLMKSACEYAKKKGVTIVCAAGNSGREGVGYPAAFPECIAISAVGPKGDPSFYTSYGKEVALAAPGGDNQVGGPAGLILQNTVRPDGNGSMVDDYFGFQGTSMASPHAAAVAAMVVAQGVRDPDDVKAVLQKSAQRKSGDPKKYGAGILDAASAVKMAANVRADGVARFWMVALLFAGCFAIGKMRQRAGLSGGYPIWGALAFSMGFLFPDWLTGFLGMTSPANLIAHSVLIPGVLLVMGADGRSERRFLGWMALGLTLHLGWEFMRGTAPFGPEIGFWQFFPWVSANILTGFGLLISGLTASRE
jgi:serine protease